MYNLKALVTRLIAGGSVPVNPDKFQNDMTTLESADDVLTLLVHLGYLTYDFYNQRVTIPNQEVQKELQEWYSSQEEMLISRQCENCKLFLQLFQKTFYLISIYKSYSKNAYFLLFRNIIARQKDWHNVSLKTNIKLLYFKSDIAFLLCIGH